MDVYKLTDLIFSLIDNTYVIVGDQVLQQTVPKELDLTSDDKDDQQVHCPGFSYSIYDKRDNFNFPIVSFPDLSGNIISDTSILWSVHFTACSFCSWLSTIYRFSTQSSSINHEAPCSEFSNS